MIWIWILSLTLERFARDLHSKLLIFFSDFLMIFVTNPECRFSFRNSKRGATTKILLLHYLIFILNTIYDLRSSTRALRPIQVGATTGSKFSFFRSSVELVGEVLKPVPRLGKIAERLLCGRFRIVGVDLWLDRLPLTPEMRCALQNFLI